MIKEITIIWINDKNNEKRFKHMTKMLERNFPDNPKIHVDAIYIKPKYHGVTVAQSVALQQGLLTGKPFIVLEDDVNFNEDFNMDVLERVMELKPKVLYLGISTWGEIRNVSMKDKYLIEDEKVLFRHGAHGKIVDDDLIRIKSMFGAHAILYVSMKYVLKTLRICYASLMMDKPHDVLLPVLQRKYQVLGLRVPMFYQDKRIGGQERETNLRLV